MNLEKFLYQLRKKNNEFYIARISLSSNNPLQLKRLNDYEWSEVSFWDQEAGLTEPCSEWLEQNRMKNHLYTQGIQNYIL